MRGAQNLPNDDSLAEGGGRWQRERKVGMHNGSQL